MLFDMRGRKRRVIQIVYGGLAVVFVVGFVGFGVGSDVGVGLLGGGHGGGGGGHGGGGGSRSDAVDDRRNDLREELSRDPRNAQAWLRLSMLEAGAAYESEDGGGHGGGQAMLADDGRERLEASVAAYERYVQLAGSRAESAVATLAARSYATLGRTKKAVRAQRRAAGRRDANAQFLLAQLAALDGDRRLVERAMRNALAAAEPAERDELRRQLPALRRQARSG